MCVLNNNRLMAANDIIFNLLQDCQLQVFTVNVLRYGLPDFKREFSRSSFYRLSRFKIADALACESNHSMLIHS